MFLGATWHGPNMVKLSGFCPDGPTVEYTHNNISQKNVVTAIKLLFLLLLWLFLL